MSQRHQPDEPPSARQVRVLHIIENLNGQAVESWLLRVLAQARREQMGVEWTFFCVVGRPGRMDEAALAIGARIIHSAHEVGSRRAFLAGLRREIRRGRYDILHCQQDIMSALPLLASAGLPVKRRIVHVHNTSISLPTSNPLKMALAREPLRRVCLGADHIVGVSQDALDAMLAGHKSRPGRDSVIHCGIETRHFEHDPQSAAQVRASMGFGASAKILLFVGRMVPYKNPAFVIEVLAHLRQSDPDFVAVFAGVGPLEEEVRELARLKYLQDAVRVLGWRDDVAQLMGASDLLLWPGVEEPKEGLGLGVVEAQAAGLPVLMSRNVPSEAVVVPEMVQMLPLSQGAQAWSEAAKNLLRRSRPSRAQAWAQVEASSFDIARSARSIAALYDLEEPR